METIQLLNTAIVKAKEINIDDSYEERLKAVCDSPAIEHLNKAIISLSESSQISKDQSAQMIVKAIRDLENIWTDYITMEGIDKLKSILN